MEAGGAAAELAEELLAFALGGRVLGPSALGLAFAPRFALPRC